jgi:hypothetical protein
MFRGVVAHKFYKVIARKPCFGFGAYELMRKSRACLTFCLLLSLLFFSNWLIRVCYGPTALSFGLSAEPLSVTIAVGGSGQSTLNVSAKGNPAVLPADLSTSSIGGVTTDLNPQQVTFPPSEGEWYYNQSTLTISATSSAIPGVYSLTVYADFGITIRNVNITVTILGSDYGNTVVGGHIAPNDKSTIAAPHVTSVAIAAALMICIAAAVRKKHGC